MRAPLAPSPLNEGLPVTRLDSQTHTKKLQHLAWPYQSWFPDNKEANRRHSCSDGERKLSGLGRNCRRHFGRVLSSQNYRSKPRCHRSSSSWKKFSQVGLYCYSTRILLVPWSLEINETRPDLLQQPRQSLKPTQITGDNRETAFLYQHLSVAIRRFNANTFHSTFGAQRDINEDYRIMLSPLTGSI